MTLIDLARWFCYSIPVVAVLAFIAGQLYLAYKGINKPNDPEIKNTLTELQSKQIDEEILRDEKENENMRHRNGHKTED